MTFATSRVARVALSLIALACEPAAAWAQGAGGDWPPVAFERGPGFYLSAWKIGAYWLLFALWVATTDWLSRDATRMKQDTTLWNGASVGAFAFALVLLFLIPWFPLGYFLLLAAYAGPLATYIVLRNRAVGPGERVLDRAHLRVLLSRLAARIGMNVAAETTDSRDAGAGVTFTSLSGSERDNSAALLKARNLPGYVPARELVFEALQKRADGILLDYGREKVAMRHQIDGVWLPAPTQQREKADPVLAVLKTLAVLNPAERRAKQAGKLGVESNGVKYECRFSSQGTETGERALLLLENRKIKFNSLEELGMRPKLVEQVSEALRRKKGMLLLSSMPAGGLTTLFDVTLNATDRFVRNFVAIEPVNAPERDIINVAVTRFDPAKGESPATALPALIRAYPDVFVARDMVNAESATILCQQVNDEDRFVFCGARAKEAVEALLRILMLKVPPAEFAKAITMVINARLIRKLCEKCKEAYAPPPEMVQKYGLPQKVSFHRPPTKPIDPKHPERKCPACGGVAYVGRTGFYEVLTVDDMMRQILVKQPKLELLRKAAVKARHRSLQDEGMLLVARGVTSLEELSRVLKG